MRRPITPQPRPAMLRLLLFPAVLAIAAYATFSGEGLLNAAKFGFVLLLALCVLIVYAFAAKTNRDAGE